MQVHEMSDRELERERKRAQRRVSLYVFALVAIIALASIALLVLSNLFGTEISAFLTVGVILTILLVLIFAILFFMARADLHEAMTEQARREARR